MTAVEEVKDFNVTAFQLVHDKTGAKYLHADCDDSNNTFNVAFRTTPTDSSGVAHVLEHTVLCGSQKCVHVHAPCATCRTICATLQCSICPVARKPAVS